MKKLLFIPVFFIITLISYSQTDTIFPQVINVGSTANDGTGDKVRTAFQKVNSNFTDIYASVISGPVNGTKYNDLRRSVKRIYIEPVIASWYYYIKKFYSGVDSASHYFYRIEIAASSTSPYTSGTTIGDYQIYSDSIYTITHRLGFKASVAPGGISGNIIIDFSKLATDVIYTCANFVQGGIFSTISGEGGGGGGGGIDVIANSYENLYRVKDAIDTLNGASSIYLLTNTANHTIRLDSIQNILQSFTLIMSDSVGNGTLYWSVVKPLGGAKINDVDSLIIYPGQWLVIYPDSLNFKGLGTVPPTASVAPYISGYYSNNTGVTKTFASANQFYSIDTLFTGGTKFLTFVDSSYFHSHHDTITYTGKYDHIKFDVRVTAITQGAADDTEIGLFNINDNAYVPIGATDLHSTNTADKTSNFSFVVMDKSATANDKYIIKIRNVTATNAITIYRIFFNAEVTNAP